MLDVFEYDDFRTFVRNWLDEEEGRSGRELARVAGVSPAQLSLVLSGKRRCTEDFITRLAGAMELVEAEQELYPMTRERTDG